MSSSSDLQTPPPSLEELSTRGATALLMPLILGMAGTGESTPREVAVFVHQRTRSLTVVEGSLGIESLLREIPETERPLPASKASIESLPLVKVPESGWECSICLSECEVNGEVEVKEMPCNHMFHSECIEKWLGIHGTCPLCRSSLPAEEKGEVEEMEGWRIHVFFIPGRRGTVTDLDPGTGADAGRVDNQDMESERDEESHHQSSHSVGRRS